MQNTKKQPNKSKYSFLKILQTSDLSYRQLPLMSIENENHGPTIWLTACAHGNEVSGMVIIHEIFKILKKAMKKGKVYAFPLMNPMGFEKGTRDISLTDEDLNRSYPGKNNGSLGERLADKIFNTILKSKPNLVLDLHNDWLRSVPYVLIDHDEKILNSEAYKKSVEFAKQTGLLPILDTEEIEKTLCCNLIKKGIPALTFELKEPYIVVEKNIDFGIKSIINILKKLGMTDWTVEGEDGPFVHPTAENLTSKTIKYSYQLSSSSGIVRYLAKPGDIVSKNQPIAKIYNSFGKLKDIIKAQDKGIVLGQSDFSVALPGIPIMSLGVF